MNKGEITSKPIYSSVIDALLNDYGLHKNNYEALFSESKAMQSMTHRFLEGIYVKYSKSLEKYMKENKDNLKLKGNKKYENVPVDLFIKESQMYKETIITELHNKYNREGSVLSSADCFFLTPLPDKPRVLLNTKQEKEEFLSAERLAVAMRTVEYTNVLRNKGNQYYVMKKDERQQMIYILKRATHTIQAWWKAHGKKGALRRREKMKEKALKRLKQLKAIKALNDLLQHKVMLIGDRLFSQMSKGNKKASQLISFHVSFLSHHNKKDHTEKWHYISKLYRIMHHTKGTDSINHSPEESIKMIQRAIKAFLQLKQSSLKRKAALLHVLKSKEQKNTKMLLKALLHFIHILYSSSGANRLILGSYQRESHFNELRYKMIIKALRHACQRRLFPLFRYLRATQSRLKGIDKLNSLLKRHQLFIGMKPIRQNVITNLLRRIVIKRNTRNGLWKYFQIWNILNLLIHLFFDKLAGIVSKAKRHFSILALQSNDGKRQEQALLLTKEVSPIKKSRYSSLKPQSMQQANVFCLITGIHCLSIAACRHYFKRLQPCSIEESNKQAMTFDNRYDSEEETIAAYYPKETNPNLNKHRLYPEDVVIDHNEGDATYNHRKRKSRVLVKAVKKYDSMEKVDNDAELFDIKKLKAKEKENILTFSHFTNKILTDSSGMKIDSTMSYYQAQLNRSKK